jgi:predicted O-linked N-acetylglucosamine transferase (SPINDLY family)
VLIEIGGSTNANRLEVMAHRLAPIQASWLGYPHSAGLATIDHIILDPYLAPTDPGLIIERPLLVPRSWIALSPGFFREEPRPALDLPEERKGRITFGSANSTYKYTPQALQAWARVLAAVPGSRFLFVRPEGGSPTFRRNLAEAFAREGVGADRLEFAPVRGGHLPYYAEMDISLDTFPLTGGTTTCEALWMGVPVVSLAGAGISERLSHSILSNAGLGDLSVGSVEAFVAKAVEVAADRDLRRTWREECRSRIGTGALGDMSGFAKDFFGLFSGRA